MTDGMFECYEYPKHGEKTALVFSRDGSNKWYAKTLDGQDYGPFEDSDSAILTLANRYDGLSENAHNWHYVRATFKDYEQAYNRLGG